MTTRKATRRKSPKATATAEAKLIKAPAPQPGSKLWEQWRNESPAQYDAFRSFLEIQPLDRTIAAAYRKATNDPQAQTASATFYRWSRDYKWAQRALARDEYSRRLRDYDEELEARKVQQMRRATLATVTKKIAETFGNIDMNRASVGDLARLLDVAMKHGREEYGQTGVQKQEVTLVNGGTSEMVQLAQKAESMTDAELVQQYRQLTGRNNATAPTGEAGDDSPLKLGQDLG